jgi:hypothetical protein
MCDRTLRSKTKTTACKTPDMSSPDAKYSTPVAKSPSTTQTIKENPMLIKLKTPVRPQQHPDTMVAHKDETSSTTPPNETDSKKFDRLFTLISILSNKVTTLNQDLKEELKSTGVLIREDMTKLEHKIVTDQDKKYVDLTTKIVNNRTDQEAKIIELEATNLQMQQQITANTEKLLAHSFQTAQLQQQL